MTSQEYEELIAERDQKLVAAAAMRQELIGALSDTVRLYLDSAGDAAALAAAQTSIAHLAAGPYAMTSTEQSAAGAVINAATRHHTIRQDAIQRAWHTEQFVTALKALL